MKESSGGKKQGGGSGGASPCAACKLLRRRCAQDCVFAPYFSFTHEDLKKWNITGSVIHHKSHASSGYASRGRGSPIDESGGDGGSRGQIDYVKPKAKLEPLTDRGKTPISEENGWGESPMQGHKPSDKPIGQGTVVASASSNNDGGVDLEMQKLDSQQKVKPKSGVQTVTKILLASTLPAGQSLSSMAKGSSISRPIYCFTSAATSIVFLGCLLALMVADKHPELAGYAGKLAIFFASIAFFSTFFI